MSDAPRILRFYGDTDFITGLRALAATMVVMIHTGALVNFGALGQAITSAGKYGVDIFFVISGYTIARTFTEAKNYQSYLTRRILRIVPLYWLAIAVAILLWRTGAFALPYWMQELGSQPDLYNFLMHLSMLSYLDYRVANSLLGVEWTIPIEVFWYVCLPLLLHFTKNIPKAVGGILVLLVLTGGLSYASKQLFGTSQPIKWSPIAHGHLFVVGAAAFYLRERFAEGGSGRAAFWIGGAVLVFLTALLLDFGGRSELLALSTAAMIVWATPQRAAWLTRPLTLPPMLFLGSISYSIYLLHMLVLQVMQGFALLPQAGLAQFLVVYSVTVALSTGTYLLVEKPTNRMGRRLAEAGQLAGSTASPKVGN